MVDVSLRNISKRFGAVDAVRDLSLTVNDGEFLVLLGPSGAGKTTTLRLITGLESPDAGSVMIDGRDVTHDPPGARDIAFVFQQYSLYPHSSVYDNLAFPLRSPARRVPEPLIRKRVEQTAELLHIASKLNNRATRLSGGEMQRVAIGRALVRDPSIYLMDEPLSSLDAKLRAELRLELKRIQLELGATILYVTHDQVEAMTMASRIGVIKDGRLLQLGTPREIYENPSSSYVASRLGTPQIDFLPARLLPDVAMPPETETVGIRTEHLQIATRNGGRMIGRVHRVEHLGEQIHVHLDYKGETLVTLADAHQPLRAGQEVELPTGVVRCVSTVRDSASARWFIRGAKGSDQCRCNPRHSSRCSRRPPSRSSIARRSFTSLDQAIGDGDHGTNMKRGFEAVLGKLDAISAQPLDEAFKTIGKTLVMTVGGASGPLYGSFFSPRARRCRTTSTCLTISPTCSAVA